MKLVLKLALISLFSLLVVPLLAVESSSSSDSGNITRGSSLSTSSRNDTSPYWRSPSGNLAFGFYRLPCTSCSANWSDEYVVGIWLVKSLDQTLVWTANPKDLPLHKPSSILFTDEGKLMLRIMPDNEEKLLLPDVPEPASYAKMQDDGNFVLYGSESEIIWQSFDYPSDTILGNQKLRPGANLISSDYRLSVRQTDGFVGIYQEPYNGQLDYGANTKETVSVMSNALKNSQRRPVILRLDNTGKLYLARSDDIAVVKVFYDDKRKKQVKEQGDYIYRATLSTIGRLNLHKERVDGNDSHDNDQKTPNTIVWSSSPDTVTKWEELRDARHPKDLGYKVSMYIISVAFVFFLVIALCVGCAKAAKHEAVKKKTAGGDLELQGNN